MDILAGLLSQDYLQEDGGRIRSLSRQLMPRLEAWATSTGLRRDVSFERLAVTIAASAPFASIEALEPPAKCGLLIIALDDLLDDPGLSRVALRQRLARMRNALHGEPVPESDHIAVAIDGLRAELAEYSLFAQLYPDWRLALGRLIEGMRRERLFLAGEDASVKRGLPSFAGYMQTASYSIGIPLYGMTGAITIGDPSLLGRLPEFRALMEAAGYAVRLANDVATRDRESDEKQVNAVTLKCQEEYGAYTEENLARAEKNIRSEIEQNLEHCRRLASFVQTSSGRPEEFMVNLATVVCAFYGIGDY